MNECAIAYVPVLHEGYRRFLESHASGKPFFVVGKELYADYRPLAKDIRALEPELVAAAVEAWDVCSEVAVLTPSLTEQLAASGARITLPAEDVSYQLVDRFFGRCEVRYDTVFLRWDKSRTVQLLEPTAVSRVGIEEAAADLGLAAETAALDSV